MLSPLTHYGEAIVFKAFYLDFGRGYAVSGVLELLAVVRRYHEDIAVVAREHGVTVNRILGFAERRARVCVSP